MFFKVKIKKVSKNLINEKLVGEEFYLFCTKKRAYVYGKKTEFFKFKYQIKNNTLIGKSICTCKDKDIFMTEIPLSKLKNKKFLVKSIIIKQHKDITTPYRINEFVVLEFRKNNNINSKKQAQALFNKK